jgi:hypothetical protein
MRKAWQTWCIFSALTVPTNIRNRRFSIVSRLHKLTQEVRLSPSADPSSTSVGALRSLEVIAATSDEGGPPLLTSFGVSVDSPQQIGVDRYLTGLYRHIGIIQQES